MALQEYKRKRSFEKTPEPTGGKSTSNKLRFVVQKHHASHLHYDFRLEIKGVLKSWAVPKGPSTDPAVSRLAMMVEDHPFDYRSFEGIIPEGNYGAGTVIIWDEGFYEPIEKYKSKKEQEHHLLSSLYKGELKFILHGKKLKGKYLLLKAPQRGPTSWLLKKIKDKYASAKDISLKDRSIVSGLTVDEMSTNKKAKKWISNRGTAQQESEVKEVNTEESLAPFLKSGQKSVFPKKVAPMLATKSNKPFTDADWIYEVKWDGYRIIAHTKSKKVVLHSRSAQNYTKQYSAVANELKKLEHDVVMDGEVVVLNKKGRPDFDALQKYNGQLPLVYYVFDILWCDGYDVTSLPLIYRKNLLTQILFESEIVKYSDHFDDGIALYEQIKELGMEGIVAKKKESEYIAGQRSQTWLKIPTVIRQQFVIGGWTESNSGRPFRSLLFGNYIKGKLHWVGHAGGGYKADEMRSLLTTLKKIETKKNPFANEVEVETKPHWVKPQLVAEIQFATWTKSKKIRKPAIFLGFRKDLKAQDVTEEKLIEELSVSSSRIDDESDKKAKASESNWPIIQKQKITSEALFTIGEHILRLTNVEQQLWKGITKADLIQYYHSISKYILPHLKDRPQSLHIKQQGPMKQGFYIKDMEGYQPEWIQIFSTKRKHKKNGKRDIIDYLVCQNEATLLYMVNLGCIDINPWTSRIKSIGKPDYIVIDLDPSDDDFSKVIDTALAAKEFFAKQKLIALPKTSGKTGMHLYIPCKNFSYPQARSIAVRICDQIHHLIPELTTTEVTISHRGSKLYIDPNQNDEADTVAAPYSVRPYHIPIVSTPLEWKEINGKLNAQYFTIHTIESRVKAKGELFHDVLTEKYRTKNSTVLKRFL